MDTNTIVVAGAYDDPVFVGIPAIQGPPGPTGPAADPTALNAAVAAAQAAAAAAAPVLTALNQIVPATHDLSIAGNFIFF